MNLSKILLPALAVTCLSGCVYEEVSYQQPRRVYHSGYAPREVVVVQRGPTAYHRPSTHPYCYEGNSHRYYQPVPARTYYHRPHATVVHVDHAHHGETWKERQRRELREAQRAHEKHDKKDDDKKKKKKKKDDD